MANIEKSMVKTEAIFSEDRQHRYLLRKEWDKNKKKAMVMMVSPSYADAVLMDTTTMCVVNNLYRLDDYGSVDIVNLYSAIDGSRGVIDDESGIGQQNMDQILASAEKSDVIIIAWGRVGDRSRGVQERQRKVIERLSEYGEKLYAIPFHPLSPAMRNEWNVERFIMEQGDENKDDAGK